MVTNLLLSLDLERGVSDERRERFYAKLKELNWTKLPKVTTTWSAYFTSPTSEVAASGVVKSHLDAAAQSGGYPAYHAVAMIGDSPPATFVS